ncbi:CPBP family glutamic-type intramembrane protease [Neobacillus drentensis]|uniref:CPBP family glutamic-type intramembrane protease n=1 Tax=Neobacillus drentensis TaxID=220684 RepID=UPI002856F3B3|nr:CPBP family glutamic-type intramembrane protease [Neobacillus drentensis]MDR7239085.1 membrane protease YdiL (CAAX protease family) [Neobacillus drentensis]
MNLYELLLIIVLLLPGLLLMAINEKNLYTNIFTDVPLPSFGLRFINHVILSVPFALLGLFFYKRAGFEDAFSLTGMDSPTLVLSLLCAFVNVIAYYFYFKKNVAETTYKEVEETRQQMWIGTRCFYGGIVEEVIFRFGIMSFFVWIGNLLTSPSILSIWAANLLASLLFSLAHLPGIYQMKAPVTKTILFYSFTMNLLVGLICGWLYWQNGLAAAIICHMLFHLIWYLFEKFVFRFPIKNET